MKNRITQLFKIRYPIIQGGMVWCSGWRLASSVSNAGGLGLIGAGSMHPEILDEHIKKCQLATSNPFGVNIPLMYPEMEKLLEVILANKVKIVFTSAGDPSKWTGYLKQHGILVIHVVSSRKFALKCVQAGVDAIVAEGFEAGGHNGKEETTTFCLVPMIRDSVHLPVIAAGGIADGKGMLAAMALGADGIQIGTRFAVSMESSAHQNFKNRIIEANEGDTILTLKKLTPVRIMKNHFYHKIRKAEDQAAERDSLLEILGKGRAKAGIFEGDLDEGELEIGQVSARINKIQPAAEIVGEIMKEFEYHRNLLGTSSFIFN